MSGLVKSHQFADLEAEPAKIDKLIHDVAKEVYTRIYNRTPVDTGHAQSQWKLTVGQTDFVVSNDVVYISALEQGHSRQAPHGMVAVTMNEIDSIIREKAGKG